MRLRFWKKPAPDTYEKTIPIPRPAPKSQVSDAIAANIKHRHDPTGGIHVEENTFSQEEFEKRWAESTAELHNTAWHEVTQKIITTFKRKDKDK